MKEIWNSLNKYYCLNFVIILTIILSIFFMFFVQFKVENLQDSILSSKAQINDYEDQIRLIEVEWVYLTRPQRLRKISAMYLRENNYAIANQIIDEDGLKKTYNADYKPDENLNKNIKTKQKI